MGQTIAYNNSNWEAVYLNLRKARMWWWMIERALQRTGETVQDRGAIYKAVAQWMLLYGSKSWVVTGEMLKVLTELHHKAALWITRMTANCGAGREWGYPSVEEVMDSLGLHPIDVYIKRRQTTI